jgi:hypothetical protein
MIEFSERQEANPLSPIYFGFALKVKVIRARRSHPQK